MTSSSLFSNTENANKSYEINGVDTMELVGSFPGILSPGPSSLIPISPNFFSVSPDPNLLSFLHDLSPIFHGNKNYIEGSFMPSPVSFFTSTPKASPTQSFDLFNLFQNY
ncbi:hypothetical protein GIB67_018338 [Kingdonia uniflora]|uniref:Uncharacterized protein n=1 Tax=Kingdonia uniflora TaxID=39325 RepID=A0A7J7MJ65_9MAGN|nr:hypothetical protein GIB67_018338 [Kingdonia uniflora]